MNLKAIIKAYLDTHGFDGLCNEHIECGCLKDDICPCGEVLSECEPGYRYECSGCKIIEGLDWVISTVHPSQSDGICPRCEEPLDEYDYEDEANEEVSND